MNPCECGCGTLVSCRFVVGHNRKLVSKQVPLSERFWSKVLIGGPDECWLWTARLLRGYGGIRNEQGKSELAHRVSWRLHYGPIPDGLCVLHDCPGMDEPRCVNPTHLWLGTVVDNNGDRNAKGRSYHGGAPKLTRSQVIEMRQKFSDGQNMDSIAEEYGMSRSGTRYAIRSSVRAQ